MQRKCAAYECEKNTVMLKTREQDDDFHQIEIWFQASHKPNSCGAQVDQLELYCELD